MTFLHPNVLEAVQDSDSLIFITYHFLSDLYCLVGDQEYYDFSCQKDYSHRNVKELLPYISSILHIVSCFSEVYVQAINNVCNTHCALAME